MTTNSGEVTGVLLKAADGDHAALNRLYELLYPELRRMAHAKVRSLNDAAVLDTTSLVHESYLRLVGVNSLTVENKRHFLSYAARVMRSVVVDFVRHGTAQRRGGNDVQLTLNTNLLESIESPAEEILRLHDLLIELEEINERLVKVVEMRYFAALENCEIADALGVTVRTVERDLEKIRLLMLDNGT